VSSSPSDPPPFSGVFADSPLPDAARIDDARFAAAYEALSGAERGILKLCIARLHRIWGEGPASSSLARRYGEGFALSQSSAPAAFAVIACPADWPAPSALLALVMPALLAGVKRLAPCFISPDADPVPASPLLAALELAGVEEAFCLSEDALAQSLAHLDPQSSCGRLLLLGPKDFCRRAALWALGSGCPLRAFPAPLYYSLEHDAVREQRFGPDGVPAPEDADESLLSLALDKAHEQVWIWPDTGPDWFINRRMKLEQLQSG
jgi:hypothetical protein